MKPDTDTDTDTDQIRKLITTWAAAVHAGDMATVLADHSDDIVMFDVPPPEQGIRGLDAYRASWPPSFDYQSGGAVFDIVDLDITAGNGVAYAHALLRCGTQEEFVEKPHRRLRLTIGLRRDKGRWTVAHEHHSFTLE